jgi:hypothetical protein
MSRNEDARMTEALAPGEVQAATRGEFLAARATAVRELEQRLSSPLGLLQNCGLLFAAVFALTLAGTMLSDSRVGTFHVVFAAVMTAAACATVPIMIRRALRTRKAIAAFIAWQTAEREARSLPPGHVRPELRTPFDARLDPDFEHFAHGVAVRDRFAPLPEWVLRRALPAGAGLVLGFVLLMAGFGDKPVGVAVTWGVAGGYLLTCSLLVIASAVRTGWRLVQILRAEKADISRWRAERIGQVAAAEVDRASLRKRWLIAAPFIVVPTLGWVVRVMTSPGATVTAVVVVVVLAGVLIAVVLLALWRTRPAPAPAEHHITAVPPG